ARARVMKRHTITRTRSVGGQGLDDVRAKHIRASKSRWSDSHGELSAARAPAHTQRRANARTHRLARTHASHAPPRAQHTHTRAAVSGISCVELTPSRELRRRTAGCVVSAPVAASRSDAHHNGARALPPRVLGRARQR